MAYNVAGKSCFLEWARQNHENSGIRRQKSARRCAFPGERARSGIQLHGPWKSPTVKNGRDKPSVLQTGSHRSTHDAVGSHPETARCDDTSRSTMPFLDAPVRGEALSSSALSTRMLLSVASLPCSGSPCMLHALSRQPGHEQPPDRNKPKAVDDRHVI